MASPSAKEAFRRWAIEFSLIFSFFCSPLEVLTFFPADIVEGLNCPPPLSTNFRSKLLISTTRSSRSSVLFRPGAYKLQFPFYPS